jgi:hypothetical protein
MMHSSFLLSLHLFIALYVQHVDGAGKVDGSVVVALPVDESSPFQGGGLTFWDGRVKKNNDTTGRYTKNEIHYDTRSGDLALIDRYVHIVRASLSSE